ncbi:MAG TPA: two-component regulator propeller domain-containing protein [Flavobacterium sp.]|uniref:ligand-binding sensor domain-containing protein n=1 Tax=Flavobacterium sp. TaxID=239 RepID=UPI002BDDEAB0|nr:two-component regulator propeller domain-containing protein [Flavobacterium sp.]HSD15470.1 two-component regulator propeller domain-containing protein [Flavobacterium sp.]
MSEWKWKRWLQTNNQYDKHMANQKKAVRQMIKIPLLLLCIHFYSCKEQSKPISIVSNNTEQQTVKRINTFEANEAVEIDKNIRSIFQDKKGNYWFGTNDAGVYRYDGTKLIQFTEKDGLSNNQVQTIQEDKFGNIWFGTGLFRVSRFDGQTFTTLVPQLNTNPGNNWKAEPDDLWFYGGVGAFRYSNNLFTYLSLADADYKLKDAQNSPYNLSPYAVYSILNDKKGNLWFGTQAKGVCRFAGKSLTWFTEKGLSGPAVLSLFEDSKGNIWFGNNGSGLFRYDGKTLVNFTEEKGLGNTEFRVSGKASLGTLARIYSINEDNKGNLWIGTVDAGVWKYDGNKLTNYSVKDGLTSNAVNTIYKDQKGDLWFGTDDDGVCKFNGKFFAEFVVK